MCGCRGSQSRPPSRAPSTPPPRRASTEVVALRYIGKVSLLVKGGVSGRVYALRPGNVPINCDRRDVPTFLASPLFERFNKHQ